MIHRPLQLSKLLKEEELLTLYAKEALELSRTPNDEWGVGSIDLPGVGRMWAVTRGSDRTPVFFTWSSDEARSILVAISAGKYHLSGVVKTLTPFARG